MRSAIRACAVREKMDLRRPAAIDGPRYCKIKRDGGSSYGRVGHRRVRPLWPRISATAARARSLVVVKWCMGLRYGPGWPVEPSGGGGVDHRNQYPIRTRSAGERHWRHVIFSGLLVSTNHRAR